MESFDNNDADLIPLPFLCVNNCRLGPETSSVRIPACIAAGGPGPDIHVGRLLFSIRKIDQTNDPCPARQASSARRRCRPVFCGHGTLSRTVEETNMALFLAQGRVRAD